MDSPAITLRDMHQDEYDAYTELRETDYVESLAGVLPPEVAKEQARQGRTSSCRRDWPLSDTACWWPRTPLGRWSATLARDAGAIRIGLNVFGHNLPAIALYNACGYEVTTQQMAKRLR